MLLNILAIIIIPLYTILFTHGYGWFTTNFSVIGNIDKKLAFLVWGILVGWYFWLIDRKLRETVSMNAVCRRLIPAALILLFCAITTPYLPELLPFKAFLHIVFAFMAAVLLLVYLLLVILEQYRRDSRRYRPYLIGLGLITAGSAVLLILVGIVSSALEIFVTLTTVLMALRLTKQMEQSRHPLHSTS